MAKCKNCDRLVLRVGSRDQGLCGACAQKILPVIARRRARIKDGMVAVRFSANDDTVLTGLQAVLDEVRALIPFERAGIDSTRPAPTVLMRLVTEKRTEVLARLRETEGPPATPLPEAEDDAVPREVWRTERRRAERWGVNLYSMLEPGGLRTLVENVSESGLFLLGASARPVGSRVRMTLYTTNGVVRASGVVRRAIAQRSGGAVGGRPGLGVQFTHPMPELTRRLRLRRGGVAAVA